MKNVLFTTTALIAMSGTAFAAAHSDAPNVTFGGDVEVGYNDIDGGIYAEGELNLTATAEFEYGVSVEVSINADLYAGGPDLGWDAFPTVKIMTERLTFTIGEVEYAGTDMFAAVDGMSFGAFPDEDELREEQGEMVARIDATFGDFAVGVSVDALGAVHPTDAVSIGATGSFGAFSFTAMFDQAQNYNDDSNDNTDFVTAASTTFGVSVGAEFGAFSVDVAYMSETAFVATDSIGVGIGATFGSVEGAAYYAINSAAPDEYGVSVDTTFGAANVAVFWDADDSGASNVGIDINYAVTDAITAYAGYDEADSFYIAAVMDIAEGAAVGASYADTGSDEHGPEEFQDGITLWVSAEF